MKLFLLTFVACLALGNAFPASDIKAGFQDLTELQRFKLKHLTTGENAEMYSGQFEGDIVLTQAQVDDLMSRNGLIRPSSRWINHTVPYIVKQSDFTIDQLEYISKGLRQLELLTCLKFVPWNGQNDFIEVIGEATGCWSYVGRLGGRQQLNLEPYSVETGCFRLATVQHEFIHALGFYHMQSASDRDDYVEIKWENIWPGTENNFEKYSDSVVTGFGVDYDYNSVMHYGPDGFSSNGLPTIVPKDPNANIGQRNGLSRRDIEKLNRMYDCPL